MATYAVRMVPIAVAARVGNGDVRNYVSLAYFSGCITRSAAIFVSREARNCVVVDKHCDDNPPGICWGRPLRSGERLGCWADLHDLSMLRVFA
jgi:hypothetical protein